jgi:hypothetical protein
MPHGGVGVSVFVDAGSRVVVCRFSTLHFAAVGECVSPPAVVARDRQTGRGPAD